MSQKFLWFLIGLSIMIAIPVFLFECNAPQKEIKTLQTPIQKPVSLREAKAPAGKAGSPRSENSSPSTKRGSTATQNQRINETSGK
jgi:hypothetical protein